MRKTAKTFLIIFIIVLLIMPKSFAVDVINKIDDKESDTPEIINSVEDDELELDEADINENKIIQDEVKALTLDSDDSSYEEDETPENNLEIVYRAATSNVTGMQKIDNVWRMVVNGEIDYGYTGLGTNDYGTWYFENGEINFKYTGNYKDKNGDTWIIKEGQLENITGLQKIANVWRIVVNGRIDYSYIGTETNDYGTWYFENGEINFEYTDTYYEGEKAYIIEEGKVYEITSKDKTGLLKINNVWRMVENGKVNYTYTGIGSNDYGTWYLENGEINFKYTGTYKDKNEDTWVIKEGQVENITGLQKIDNIWRMLINGRIDYSYTGEGKNDYGTWYVENGEIPLDKTGLFKISGIWRMVVNGKIDLSYTGLGTNEYGTWYFENGEITLDRTELFKIDNVWRMVDKGQIDYSYTGVGENAYGIWYLENGEINFNYTDTYYEGEKAYIIENGAVYEITLKDYNGLLKVNNEWRIIVNGKIDYNYSGVGTNDYGTWYFENGKINFNFTGIHYQDDKTYIIENGSVTATILKDTTGMLKIHNVWRMVVNGKIDYDYIGLGTNAYGMWYFEKGKINFNYIGCYKDENGDTWVVKEGQVENTTGLLKISNVWRMVVSGKIDYNYTGVGTNAYGTWYLENGEINFNYTGTYDEKYIIENGQVYATVAKDTTGLLKINNTWRMIENGKVNYTYTGLGINAYGTWLFENGKINTNYNGTYTNSDGSVYTIKVGRVTEVISLAGHPATMWVDEPINNNKYRAGELKVSGWALTDETGDTIKIYLDGKYIGVASRKARPDVFEVYKDNEYGGISKNPTPGYYYTVNTKGLSNGNHTVQIINYASDGKTIIQSREISFTITSLDKAWGIDVSQYQKTIDWNAVKRSGVEFAILRIGYYLESSGQVVKDPYFEQYYNECKRLGIAVGGYFYSYAFNASEASREAAACLSIIRGKHFEMPIFLDVEDNILKNAVADGRTNVNELTNASITFCDTMNNSGFRGGVYASKNFFNTYLNTPVLERYNIWLAHYTTTTDYTGKFDIWQYTSSGIVSGINGNVDLDWCFTRYY